MLFRKSYYFIDNWFKEGHTNALLIDGARQVGKTTLIHEYLIKNNINYVELNLLDNKDALDAFNTSRSAEELLLKLTALSKKTINDDCVFFIDEIQEAEDAITPIKFLTIDSSYRFVFSGSLLGIKLKNINSIGIGYLSILNMYPMDFEEFALANGVSKKIIDYLFKCYLNYSEVDKTIHEQMMKLFNIYLIIGGMPNCVNTYVNTHNIQKVLQTQSDIDNGYLVDITKYDKKDKLLIEDIYNLIPSELNSQNKRMILKDLNKKARFYQYEESFVWLSNSGVGLFTYNVDNPVYPLLSSKERTLFKLFLCDVGILSYKLLNGNQIRVLNGEVNINYGALYEAVVAQELNTHGYSLFYYNNKTRGEIDFLIEDDSQIIPIEVKSGKDYKRHSALDKLILDYKISKAFVFDNDNVERKKEIIYLPIYMIMFIKRNNQLNNNQIFIPDISALK